MAHHQQINASEYSCNLFGASLTDECWQNNGIADIDLPVLKPGIILSVVCHLFRVYKIPTGLPTQYPHWTLGSLLSFCAILERAILIVFPKSSVKLYLSETVYLLVC